jgi:hypothetical protein
MTSDPWPDPKPYPPGEEPPDAPPPPKSRRRTWVVLGALGAAAVVVLSLALAFKDGHSSGSSLQSVQQKCTAPAVLAKTTLGAKDKTFGDFWLTFKDKTLTLDTVGDTDLVVAHCVFDTLKVPTRVLDHISTTRALDGQQTDSWDSYKARWTYHPDDGLNMSIWT